jgi:hypothetical protein
MTYPQDQYYQAVPARSNGLGIAGFIVSLVGLVLTCGVLCPIGLLLSLIALFRPPRGFAVAGFVIGLIGTLIPVVILLFYGFVAVTCVTSGFGAFKPMLETFEKMQKLRPAVEGLPAPAGEVAEDVAGEAVVGGENDGWGHPMRYRKLGGTQYEIRSAGADGAMDTRDDITQQFTLGEAGPTGTRPPTVTPPRVEP